MTLSTYHQTYSQRPDKEIAQRAKVKEAELRTIFETIQHQPQNSPVRIAVLGCGEKRFIKHHRQIFTELLNEPVDLTTFDITVEHLIGEDGVIQHDVSLPLPNGPYDIILGHVLLKFIPTEQQWNVLMNSWNALRAGGLAIHVLGLEEVDAKGDRLSDGLYSVPLSRWKKQLSQEGINYKAMDLKIEGVVPGTICSQALVLFK